MDERSERMERRFQWPVLIAAMLVIPVIAIEESDVDQAWVTIAAIGNWAIWLVFAAELVAMLIVVPDRWAWIRRHPIEVAIVVLTPPFYPASVQALRAIRLLRLLRLVRLGIQVRRMFTVDGVRYAAFLALLTVLAGGAAYATMEDQPTLWTGLYWAVTTITTVGYGDVSPETTGGRALAVVVMLVGIGFVATLTGAIAQHFIAADVREIEREMEEASAEEEELLGEVQAIAGRLQRLERRLAERSS